MTEETENTAAPAEAKNEETIWDLLEPTWKYVAGELKRALEAKTPEGMVEELYWSTLAMPFELFNAYWDWMESNPSVDSVAKSAGQPVAAPQPQAQEQPGNGSAGVQIGRQSAPATIGQPGAPVIVGQPSAPVQVGQENEPDTAALTEYMSFYTRLNELIAEKVPPAEYAKLDKQKLNNGQEVVVVNKAGKAVIKPHMKDICADAQIRAHIKNLTGKDLVGAVLQSAVLKQAMGKGLDAAAQQQPISAAPSPATVGRQLQQAGSFRKRAVEIAQNRNQLHRARQGQERVAPVVKTRDDKGQGK